MILTLLMVVLWLLIPGFPFLIFFLLPPIFFWGSQTSKEEQETAFEADRVGVQQSLVMECRFCGKTVSLEPDETYCPHCGERIRA